MSASPGTTYTHDAVGNRLTKVVGSNSTSYGWDAVNRMVETGPTSGSKNQYKYRVDGMRVRKTGGGVTESVYYDGQMPVETFEDVSGSNDVLTQNFVGARGIEMIETKVGSGSPTQAYPLYDGHGNMVATLATTGTAWSVSNERSYDVWGSVRSGATTGGPKGRYVANLGHVQDDESGLIYMRARYYEPGTGRFVSEDRAMDGSNWYLYCESDPINYVDYTGNFKINIGGGYWIEWQKGDKELAWGDYRTGQRGQYIKDGGGKLKHPNKEEEFNNAVRKLLKNAKDPKVLRALGKAGNIGLCAYALVCSLDGAFLSNPYEFADMIDYVGGSWDILGGYVTVESTGF